MIRKTYKHYQVEIISSAEREGYQAWAKITPPVSAGGAFSILDRGYETKKEAEEALWEEAKKRIDQAIAKKKGG